ncbi:VP3 [Gokushovirus WZ-2015a]|nr:VP3 [Gokushovirus WZ-2015a]
MRSPHFSQPCLNPEAFPSEVGSPLVKLFEPVFDGRSTSLREVGTKNIQKEMDALAKYCDINYMLTQLSNGDTSCLTRSQPLYGDFSVLPDNPADVLNLVNGAQAAFGQLPASERSRFSNDWRVWFAANLQDSRQAVDIVEDNSVSSADVQPDNFVNEEVKP